MTALGTLSQDTDALSALYHATGGSVNWIHKRGWDVKGSDPCLSKWFGVVCNDASRVTGLDMNNNNLTGFLPDALSQVRRGVHSAELTLQLSALISLDLSSNRLRGPLPQGLSLLSRLRRLVLANNFLQVRMSSTRRDG